MSSGQVTVVGMAATSGPRGSQAQARDLRDWRAFALAGHLGKQTR